MPEFTPKPNDSASAEERLKKTVNNMEKAEIAMEFAEGKELAAIQEKNAQRREGIKNLKEEIREKDKSRINGYF
ncbi:small, acid-soluble spore protein tlp [Sporosarcina sp. NPDC096371]|uniref:small, acid-soluble spore protein tlp n=1 Tax=Sporosarcina sp. NPDC096371 TaxID=3364530 RepID=UPI00381817D5